jgi:hypothetical protein
MYWLRVLAIAAVAAAAVGTCPIIDKGSCIRHVLRPADRCTAAALNGHYDPYKAYQTLQVLSIYVLQVWVPRGLGVVVVFRSGVVVGVRSRRCRTWCVHQIDVARAKQWTRFQGHWHAPPPQHLRPFGMCTTGSAKTSKAQAVCPHWALVRAESACCRGIGFELPQTHGAKDERLSLRIPLSPRYERRSLVGGKSGKSASCKIRVLTFS